MKSLVLGLMLVLAIGCSNDKHRAIADVTVPELQTLLARDACTPVDANGPTTRKSKGVIPGAIRLSDYETFSAAELPADRSRPLVFYCANEQCGASHTAAAKALATGHTNVRVLSAGIMGWTQAGGLVEPGA